MQYPDVALAKDLIEIGIFAMLMIPVVIGIGMYFTAKR
jgi:hypothetical protein